MKRVGKKPITTTTTPSSSSRSSITTTTTTTTFTFMEQDRSELTKDSSCYFPGCKKNANCNCQICLDSINATLDLIPLTTQKKTSLANLNPIRPSPIPFNYPSLISTPKISIRRRTNQWSPIPSPCWKSTARVQPKATASAVSEEKDDRSRKQTRSGGLILIFVLLILGMKLGFPLLVSRSFRIELSPEIIRDIGKRAFAVEGMNLKLRMLQSELKMSVNSKISNCTHNPKAWKTTQKGLLLSSRCVLYKSVIEEVSVWGWPLKTAGLLASQFSSRTFIVLSGRVTKRPEGKVGYMTVKAGESWVQDKYTTYAVQMDAQTWVVEYKRNMLLEQNNGLFSTVWKFLVYNLSKVNVGKMSSAIRSVAKTFGGYSNMDAARVHPT